MQQTPPRPEAPLPPPTLDAWLNTLCPAQCAASLAAWQQQAATASLLRAKQNSAFYAEHLAGFTGAEAQKPGWLQRLPFTSAATLQAEGNRMLCVPAHEVARIRNIPTSGSTGHAKRIPFTPGDLARTVDFFSVGMQPLVPPGASVAVLMSNGREGSVASLLAEGLARFGAEAIFAGPPASAEETAEMANGAHCLVGLPAEILYLCRKYPALRPKTVLLSADYLPPGLVNALAEEWGCEVYSHYGLTETGYGLAVQCTKRGGHHLRLADFLPEIIDPVTGEPLPLGAEGELVLTSLRSEALPLVRYRTGDIASLEAEPCACGSVHLRLGAVRGRYTRLRQRVNIHLLDDLLLPLPGLCGYWARWQNGVLCLLAEGRKLDTAALEKTLGCPVKAEYGPLPPSGGGKRDIQCSSFL